LSKEEIEDIRELEYQIADALFENWLTQRINFSKAFQESH
jgi:hypothetical protein